MDHSTLVRIVSAAETVGASLLKAATSKQFQAFVWVMTTDEGAATMRRYYAGEIAKELRAAPPFGLVP